MPAPAPQTALRCTRCDKPLPGFARYCKRCGMAMFAAAPPPTKSPPIYPPAQPARFQPAPLPPIPAPLPQPQPCPQQNQGSGCLGMILLIAAIAGGSWLYRHYNPKKTVRPFNAPVVQPKAFTPKSTDPAELVNGNAFLRSGQYDSAISTFSAGLRKHPGHRGLLAARATAYFWKDDRVNALADYRTLFNSNATDYPNRHIRNRMEILAGDKRAALWDAQYVALQRPNDAIALLLQGQAELWNEDSNGAQICFAKAMKADPRIVETVRQQGQTYLDAGLYTQANYDFLCLVWMQPNNSAAWYGLARCRAALGWNNLAVEAYTRYLTYDQTSQYAENARREINRLRGR